MWELLLWWLFFFVLIWYLSMKLVRMVFLYNVVYVCNVYVLLEYCLIKLKYNIIGYEWYFFYYSLILY